MDVLKFVVRIILLLLIPAVVAISTYVFINERFYRPAQPGNSEPVYVLVEPTDNLATIADKVEEASLIKNSWVLEMLSRLKSGPLSIKAGEYEFSKSMTPGEILNRLASGEVFVRAFTVVAGTSVWEMGDLVEQAGLASKAAFETAVVDRELLNKAGIRADSFEGYLGPGDYQFTRGESVDALVWAMLERMEQLWDPVYSERLQELNLNRHEVLTLASLIQEESVDPAVQKTVSAVLHKRLNSLMKLRSDPSVLYGLEERDVSLIPEHFVQAHPYNTYMNYGLPPGPISTPGKQAIEAALYPEDTQFLFYTRDPLTGALLFFEEESAYREAFEAYQNGLKERQGVELAGPPPQQPDAGAIEE